jgi:hypothetical protein
VKYVDQRFFQPQGPSVVVGKAVSANRPRDAIPGPIPIYESRSTRLHDQNHSSNATVTPRIGEIPRHTTNTGEFRPSDEKPLGVRNAVRFDPANPDITGLSTGIT